MTARNDRLVELAKTVIAEMEHVDAASEERARRHARRSWGEATPTVERELKKIEADLRAARSQIMREPFIAFVRASQDGGERLLLFCRNYIPECSATSDAVEYVSYLAPVGEVASRAIGSVVTVQTPGGRRALRLLERDVFRPRRIPDWDATENEIELGPGLFQFEKSLRALLRPAAIQEDLTSETPTQQLVVVEVLPAFEALEEAVVAPAPEVVLQVLRQKAPRVAEIVQLRDQPVLDSAQDPIFRLPVGSQLVITGAPGTGKTTLLIKRLSQKTKAEFLRADEIGSLTTRQLDEMLQPHRSWVLFTPTELLRDYLKEALGREGLPATSQTVRLWDDERLIIGRDVLRILHVGKRGYFRHSPNADAPFEFGEEAEILARFEEYFAAYYSNRRERSLTSINEVTTDLNAAIGDLAEAPISITSVPVAEMARSLTQILGRVQSNIQVANVPINLAIVLAPERAEILDLREELEQVELTVIGELLKTDGRLIEMLGGTGDTARSKLRDGLSKLYRRAGNRKSDQGSDTEATDDTLEPHVLDHLLKGPHGKQLLAVAVTKHAINAGIGASDSLESIFASIPRVYNSFRKRELGISDILESDAIEEPVDSEDEVDVDGGNVPKRTLSNPETDLLIYFALASAQRALNSGLNEHSKSRTLERIKDRYRTVVAVDEAADFSWVQLGCMYNLADPAWRSFAMCGDLMQRVTTRGIRRWEDCQRFAPDVKILPLTVAYRQSRTLLQIARRMYTELMAEEPPFDSPYLDDVEPRPLLFNNGDLNEASRWIAARIVEIYTIYDSLPTIAVFVPNDSDIDAVCEALGNWLEDDAIPVEACKDGKVLGEGQRVRVFAVEHIKGLEFHAVFLMGFDRMYAASSDLAGKYLYVGLSRAIMFVALTVDQQFPADLRFIEEEFTSGDWKSFVPSKA